MGAGSGVDVELLAGAPGTILADLPEMELRAIGMRLRRYSYPPGTTLVEQGSRQARLYILVTGELQVSMTDPEGNVFELARLLPGESAGEMSLLSGEPASASVATTEDSVLWVLTGVDFVSLVDTCPVFARNLARLLSKRVAHTDRELAGHFERLMHLRVHAETPVGLAEAIADAAAWHLAIPLLVLDHRDVSVWREAQCIASVDVLDAPQILGRLQRRGLPGAVAVSTAGAEPAVWPQLEEWLSEHVTHALVISPFEHPPPGIACLKSSVRCEISLLPAHTTSAPGISGDAILLAPERRANTRRELQHETDRIGRPVVRLIAPGGSSARADINWVARHLAGMKVGLVLGGGGVLGFAHLGVIRALRRADVPLDYLAGSSVGALVAGGIAHGFELEALEQTFATASEHIVKFTVPRQSILSNRGLVNIIRRLAGDVQMEDLPIPLAVVAVDIIRGQQVILDRGPLWLAATASAAIPGVYPPIWLGGRCLVDGGVLDPVPSGVARELGADVVVAVSLSTSREAQAVRLVDADPDEHGQSPHVLDTILRAIDLMSSEITRSAHGAADVTIDIQAAGMGLRDSTRAEALASVGEAAVQAIWSEIGAVLPWLRESLV